MGRANRRGGVEVRALGLEENIDDEISLKLIDFC